MGADRHEPAGVCLLSVLARRDRRPFRPLPAVTGAGVPRLRTAWPGPDSLAETERDRDER